jgi:alpha-amylase
VGNFDWVFEECYQSCYLPFLKLLEKYPRVRAAIHVSGPLLEWMEESGREFLDILGLLSDRNQLEIISGGFYEPILSLIPRRDAVGQIQMMSSYIEKKFGKRPKGI